MDWWFRAYTIHTYLFEEESVVNQARSTWKNIRTGARKCPPIGAVSVAYRRLYLKFIP